MTRGLLLQQDSMAGRLRPQTAPRSGPLLRNNDGDDADSIASFQTSPSPTKASARLQTWTGNAQVRVSDAQQHQQRGSGTPPRAAP